MSAENILLAMVTIGALFAGVGGIAALVLSSKFSSAEEAERDAHPSITAARKMLGGRRDE